MKATFEEIDHEGFEARLLECSDPLRELVNYIRSSAKNAGNSVTSRRFRHPPPNTGWGVTYYVNGTPFCEIHPKRRDGHAWVLPHGADMAAVLRAGFEPSEQPGWFKIHDMREAVRFVPWILQSYDQRSEMPA